MRWRFDPAPTEDAPPWPVMLTGLGHVLPAAQVATSELEAQLEPLYAKLGIPKGQIEAMTGIQSHRVWDAPQDGHTAAQTLVDASTTAVQRALEQAGCTPNDVDALTYAGVCRAGFEPATACPIAAKLGLPGRSMLADVSNACLGMLSAAWDLASRIALGQIDTGVVVACESSAAIQNAAIHQMLQAGTLEAFAQGAATLTGGSAACALVLQRKHPQRKGAQLVGGHVLSAPQHHDLCQWHTATLPGLAGSTGIRREEMRTNAAAVLQHGVQLGQQTWQDFLATMRWDKVDRTICHQVGSRHRKEILAALALDPENDFTTYTHLGNTGSVALPLSCAQAVEKGFIQPGHRVAWLGIGSGLNAMMLGFAW